MKRRNFLKGILAAGGAVVVVKPADAAVAVDVKNSIGEDAIIKVIRRNAKAVRRTLTFCQK